MKRCPVCNRDYPDYAATCKVDGTALGTGGGLKGGTQNFNEPDNIGRKSFANENFAQIDAMIDEINKEKTSPIEKPEPIKEEPNFAQEFFESEIPPQQVVELQSEADEEDTLIIPKMEPFQHELPVYNQNGPMQPHLPPHLPPHYAQQMPPPPPKLNPWKPAFFALLCIVALGSILFVMQRGANTNTDTDVPLSGDPQNINMQPVDAPMGVNEANVNTLPTVINTNTRIKTGANINSANPYPYPQYPPYPDANVNANANIDTEPNVIVRPAPKNANANANTNPSVDPSPVATPTPKPAPTEAPPPKQTATPASNDQAPPPGTK